MSDSVTPAQGNNIRDSLIVCAAIVIILAGAKQASYLLQPFLLAIFIAVICSAPINSLKARGVPGWLASVLVGLAMLVVLAMVFSLIGGTVDDFRSAMPGYQEQFRQLVGQWSNRLEGFGISFSRDGLATVLNPAAAMGYFGGFLGGLGDMLGNFVLILFTVIFILADVPNLPGKMAAMAHGREKNYMEAAHELLLSMNGYLRTKAQVSALTGILVWIGLTLLDVPFAALWSFLAFVLNFIPNVGSIIAAAPPVLLSLLEGSALLTGSLVLLYLAVNTLVGNVIEPRWMGQAVGLSTLAVFVSLVFWGYMFGAIGMLLSVPLTMVVKFMALQNPGSAWFGILLSNGPPVEAEEEVDEQE